ncbi:unnamed protein product [Menidia menidia]|uniref:(Atlantic silverside) hypothetical protein n=1 Tax=Menidia menidia TaxID=238744 RepID=A0A8S4C0C2_9TELE|nr:unnamed protein product [Menidia menidia]
MRTSGGIILLFPLALLVSAQGDRKCPPPVEYQNASLVRKVPPQQRFSSGARLEYGCREDFTPAGGRRDVECLDGSWTKLTLLCKLRTCGNAGDLPNGQLHYEGETYIGERVYATCNSGYTLRGKGFMTCKASGWTGEFPSCIEGWSRVTCSHPAVQNSVQTFRDPSVFRVGDSLKVSCKKHFQLQGAAQMTCGEEGLWQPLPPRCLPSPTKTQTPPSPDKGGCGAPPPARDPHAHLADKYITMASFSSGDRVYYMCEVGYFPAGGSKMRMCNNGKWTELKMNCERTFCGNAGEIENGLFFYTGVMFGDTATAVCNDGFKLVGKATRHCMHYDWDGRVPVCEAVDCPEPQVTNAERKDYGETPYLYRSVISYECRSGTLVGPKEIWCTENGTWSAAPPECKEITCPSPNVRNGLWIGSHRQRFQPMETLTIVCERGFTISGRHSIVCSSEGQWTPSLPECRQSYPAYFRG